MSRTFYDDNYGFWEDMDGWEAQRFYRETQKKSVRKQCSICGRMVRIKPEYDKCGRCADMIERGMDY